VSFLQFRGFVHVETGETKEMGKVCRTHEGRRAERSANTCSNPEAPPRGEVI
jgi:hypothetical protein